MLIVFAGFDEDWHVEACSAPLACEFTTHWARRDQADAVVFHPTLLADAPLMTKGPRECWVAWSMESDVTIPALADAAALEPFDFTMTYRRGCDVWVPYVSRELLGELLAPPKPKTATYPVARVQSNPYDRSGRNRYASELMKATMVASYGTVAPTATWPSRSQADDAGPDTAWGRRAKLDVIARHKFTLAFENSIAVDYVTEKFFDPLVAGSVPVYLGAPNVAEFAPAPHSYIATADFSGPADLARYLNYLTEHDDDYQEYLAWKETGFSDGFLGLVEATSPHPFCRLAELVSARARERERGVAAADGAPGGGGGGGEPEVGLEPTA